MLDSLKKLVGIGKGASSTIVGRQSASLDAAKAYRVVMLGPDRGYFEHLEKSSGELGGNLWFENDRLIDFDGTEELPEEVKETLIAMGIDVSDIDLAGW